MPLTLELAEMMADAAKAKAREMGLFRVRGSGG